MENNKVKILGAGPSGLAAAISLAQSGYEVEVFERNSEVGKRFGGDIQGLENWTEKIDVLEDLQKRGIEINFDCDPVSNFTFTNGIKNQECVFNKPVFYLVKRGFFEGSLDYGLKEQAMKLGVKINFNSTIPKKEADIIATGPISNKIAGIVKGLVFKTTMPDTAICILNDRAAYKGYSYLLITKGYGCICSVVIDKLEKTNDCFEETKRMFKQMVDLKMENPKEVGGSGSFSIPNNFKENKSLLVGESAGVQDFFAGFGMRSAIISGNLAAQSIIYSRDYEELANKYFQDKQKASLVIRFLWERMGFNNYSSILNKAKIKGNSFNFLYSYTNFNKAEKLIYPLAYMYMKLKSRI